jgi:hypothetical protein
MRCVLWLGVALACVGCAKGTEAGNPFGTVSVPSADDPLDDEGETDTDDAQSAGSISAGDDGSTGGESDTDGGDGTTTGEDPSTTDDTSEATGDDTSDTMDEPEPLGPGQPATGMWSHCTLDNYGNCINGAATCLYTENPDDGYCTRVGCLNPALDCREVPPDSNATASCISDGGANSFCALACTPGVTTCPAGMICNSISFDQVTVLDICM